MDTVSQRAFARIVVDGRAARDLAGFRSGRLVVVRPLTWASKYLRWLCRCDCGRTAEVPDQCLLRAKATQSCGCLRDERTAARCRTHGMTNSPTYQSWCSMITRCENQNRRHYASYGGRGILVCERWRHSFEAFLADMGERPKGTTLDRINNDGNYEPGNCRWATSKQQANNKRKSVRVVVDGTEETIPDLASKNGLSMYTLYQRRRRGVRGREIVARPESFTITVAGVTRTIPEWEAITGVSRFTMYNRLRRGDAPEKVISVTRYRTLTINGETMLVSEWAARVGVDPTMVHHRLARGLSPEQALAPSRRRQPERARQIASGEIDDPKAGR